ncbi:hypothetical protein [Vibrio sp. D431a]|nr:hypothetical protein [Vibrio sp. D431a]
MQTKVFNTIKHNMNTTKFTSCDFVCVESKNLDIEMDFIKKEHTT